ncbi:MAG TPA: enolase C-terminal domain-like protein [Anaerohalosphaeraceae bacterium]|nr:enolase C-terminal domain-like protein [Anaerohalosphaeraceae bacterium]
MKMHRRQFIREVFGLWAAGCAAGRLEAASDKQQEWNKSLAQHRIASVDVKTVQLRWPRQVGKNSRLDVHGWGPRETVCRITTDKGAAGWGQFLAGPQDVQRIRSAVKDRTAADLFDPAVGILKPELRPLDFALHDLAGVILGVPVYEMLGHHGPAANLCYSGMIYFDDLEPPDNPAGIENVLQNCRQDIEYGHRQLKVKIGRGNRWMDKEAGLARDIEVTQRIAAEFAGIDILVDGNDGFTCDSIIRYLEGIGDIRLFWIEEPFAETAEDYAKLKDWLKSHNKTALTADGEYNPDEARLLELLKAGLVDVALQDICGYGFTAWRKYMTVLKDIGVKASPHAWGSRLKTHYTAHLAAGLGNVLTIEGVTCTSDDVDFGDYPLKDGKLVTSSAAGFGMTLKE